METTIKKKLVQIQIPPSMDLQIKEMGAHFGMGQAVLIRYAITHLYNGDYRKAKFGYHGGMDTGKLRVGSTMRRNAREEQIKAMTDMDPDSFLDFLIEVGYIEQDQFHDIAKKTKRYFISVDSANRKNLAYRYIDSDGTEGFPQPVDDYDDIIKNLIKEKRI